MRILAVLLGLLALAFQEPTVEELLRRLDSDDIAIREKAAADLVGKGPAALPALEAAAGKAGAEARARLRLVIRQLRARRWTRVVASVDNPFSPFGRSLHLRATPDGKSAAGADVDTVTVWTFPEGRYVRSWRPHPDNLSTLTLGADGTRLLTVGRHDKELALWEFPSGREIRRFESTGISPRQILATPDGAHLAVACGDVQWIEAATGRVVWKWTPRGGIADTLDLSPDGKAVLVGAINSSRLAIVNEAGALVREVDVRGTLGHETSLHWISDGKEAVVLHRMAGGRKIDLATGRETEQIDPMGMFTFLGRTTRFRLARPQSPPAPAGVADLEMPGDSVTNVFHTPDDRYVLASTLNGKSVRCFDLRKGNSLNEIGTDVRTFTWGTAGVLVGTRTGEVVLYDIQGKELKRARHGEQDVRMVAFAGGPRVISVGSDHAIRCFDLDTGKALWSQNQLPFKKSPHVLHPDGKRALGAFERQAGTEGAFSLWDLETGRQLKTYFTTRGLVTAAAISADGTRLAGAGREGMVGVWEVETGKRLWWQQFGAQINWLAFLPDGKSFISGGEDGHLERRDSSTGERLVVMREQGSKILDGVLSTDGSRVAVRGDYLSVYDTAKGESLGHVMSRGPCAFAGNDTIVTPQATLLVAKQEARTYPQAINPSLVALDESGSRIVLVEAARRRVVVAEADSGRMIWDFGVPFAPGRGALMRKGELLVLTQEEGAGKWAAYAVGNPKPVYEASQWPSGIDVENGWILVPTNEGGMKALDAGNGEVKAEFSKFPEGRLHIPRRSLSAFVLKNKAWSRLNRKTLEVEAELPELAGVDYLESDPTGELLISGALIIDSQSGQVLARIETAISEVRAPIKTLKTWFTADGESIRAVTPQGLVVTLKPAP